jgi:DNA-binding NarL/FixJ family response regulator
MEPIRASVRDSRAAYPPKIILADDHPLLRLAVGHALSALPQGAIFLEAWNLSTLETRIAEHGDADLVLLDLNIPGARGFSAMLFLRAEFPALPIVIISSSEDRRTIRRAQQFGAAGFIPKSTAVDDIRNAINAVLNGESWFPSQLAERSSDDAKLAAQLLQLSPQQLRVLMCVADGMLNKQIAYELGLAHNTVKVHITGILRKLGVNTRTQAALLVKALEPDYDPRGSSLDLSAFASDE